MPCCTKGWRGAPVMPALSACPYKLGVAFGVNLIGAYIIVLRGIEFGSQVRILTSEADSPVAVDRLSGCCLRPWFGIN